MDLATWQERGSRRRIGDHDIFVVDVPAERDEGLVPLLLVHGYPTSSVDWAEIVAPTARDRRVVTFDFLGFGLSDKPDQPYSLFGQADVVEGVVAACGLDRVVLVTHDMGDSVGGEVLARALEGTLPFEVVRRVVTNGSIYLELAELTPGQLAMLDMPDELLAEEVAPTHELLMMTLTGLMGDAHREAAADRIAAGVDGILRDGGNRLMVRINRYLAERREHEVRWTGAIERHPAPLGIIWGDADPIAVPAMAHRLADATPGSKLRILPGVGHFPMVEDPAGFAETLLELL